MPPAVSSRRRMPSRVRTSPSATSTRTEFTTPPRVLGGNPTGENRTLHVAHTERAIRRRADVPPPCRSEGLLDDQESTREVEMSARRSAPSSRGGAHHARQPAAPRTALVNRLRAVRGCVLITLVAPPGYGKTTLLSQWAERDPRPFTWIRGDRGAALERVARARTGVGKPTVRVFDDAHLLGDDETAAVS